MIISHPTNKSISLTFNEKDHSYIDNENSVYTSVTTLIGKYFEPFESEIIAERCAIKRGTTKEALLKEWKDIAEAAAHQGSEVHNMLQCLFTNIEYTNKQSEIYKRYDKQTRLIHNHIINEKKLIPVFIEKILFDPIHKVAGTVDGVFLFPDKSKYLILDWKTSKHLDTYSVYKKYGYFPFDQFHDCNHVHYSIQVMIYSWLLKTQGYLELDIPIEYRIIHVTPRKSTSFDINKEIKKIDIGTLFR
jgi:ATP-dependent exoDNAse (exonuclease V) beta subunit